MAAPSRQSMRDRVRETAEKAATGGSSYIKIPDGKKVTWFQPKVKDDPFAIDFLPYEVSIDNHPKGMKPGDLWVQKSFKVHYNIGAEEKAYVCPKTIGQKCPICEERVEMANDPKADEAIIKALAPKDRTLYQLIDLDEEKKGVQLWDYSYHLFEKRLLSDINKAEHSGGGRKRVGLPHGGFGELEGGQTLLLSFTQKTMGTNKFFETDRIDAEDREDYGDEILDDVLDLDTILEVLPYDKLKAIFLAVDDHKKEAKEEDSGRSRRGQSKEEPEPEAPSRRRGKAEPEEEPEPEPTSRRGRKTEPEPEKEEAPTGRRGRRSEPEPEPEEKPTGRRGRASEPKEEEEEKPAGRPSRKAAKDDPECIAGGTFGVDSQKHDACYDCPDDIWKACSEKHAALKKK